MNKNRVGESEYYQISIKIDFIGSKLIIENMEHGKDKRYLINAKYA